MRYQFVAEQQHEYEVKRLRRVLEVWESGYYAWKKRKASRRGPRERPTGQRGHRTTTTDSQHIL